MRSAQQALDRDFSLFGQLRFVSPRIGMSLFIMSYLVADGVLIAHYLGTTALAALNLTFPIAGVMSAGGIMLSSGGSSVVSRRLGADRLEDAHSAFTTILWAEAILGALLGFFGWLFMDPLFAFLGIDDELVPLAAAYQAVVFLGQPLLLLSFAVQTFFTTAGYPKFGLYSSIASGVTNVVLDIFFMGPLEMGMAGAAWATVISWFVTGLTGVAFFGRKNAPLQFRRGVFEWRAIKNAVTSGFAEMVSSLSHAVTLFLFNRAFKGMLGIDGVAALTIASYSTYVFNSVFYGFSEATAAIIGFKYGRKDWAGLKKVFGNAAKTALAFSGLSFLLSILFYEPVLAVFTAPGTNVYAIVAGSFTLYATTLLFSGSNMFAAYFFTAFGDGRRAAILSFCRTFLFMILAIETLPLLLGEPGLWLAPPRVRMPLLCDGPRLHRHERPPLRLRRPPGAPHPGRLTNRSPQRKDAARTSRSGVFSLSSAERNGMSLYWTMRRISTSIFGAPIRSRSISPWSSTFVFSFT